MKTDFNSNQPLPKLEENILKFWQDQNIQAQALENRQGSEPFVFYEGPPTANAKPGIHHVLARTFKDVICRYQTMKGRYVKRKAGWDTHGLPVELQVEKALGLKNKKDIESFGVGEFNKACRDSVWENKEQWEKLTNRMGYWLDLNDPYVTYEKSYIESVWWALKKIWDKGLIYQDYKIIPYCTRCGTGLSMAEVTQGYKDVTDQTAYVKFELVDEANAFVLAWTTTPWTLPGNVALAVGKNIVYTKIKQGKSIYYCAKNRLNIIVGEYTIVEELSGGDLVDREYRPLFDFVNLGKIANKKAYYIVAGDFVTDEDGTGIVHIAPMYGEDDFNLAQPHDLPTVHTVDQNGLYNENVDLWTGQAAKSSESAVLDYLSGRNLIYKTEDLTHSYPYCWRCSTALLYYARNSWFIKIDQATRDRLVELNSQVKWIPEHIRDGRFGNWLEGLRDWAISRERYWGTPLPIWICDQNHQHQQIVDSLDTLKKLANDQTKSHINEVFDLHRPYIDAIELNCPNCSGSMKRVPEVLDVWFDSGAMPFAQWGYPKVDRSEQNFNEQFPADFIAEAIDQTRGWFNTLIIISTLVFDRPAYKSVICLNHLLDENGQKMSKSKGNTVDPWSVINETGIDPLRMYFLSVNQPGDPKNFSLKAVQEVSRKSVMIWRNVISFLVTYAGVDGWQSKSEKGEILPNSTNLLDQWLIALMIKTSQKMDQALTDLDTFTASREFNQFINDLSTWYLRRSRKRRDEAFYETLHFVLVQTSILIAPIMPFMAEDAYQSLKSSQGPLSVHFMDYPNFAKLTNEQEKLLTDMNLVRELASIGHALRANANLKVRQPLAELRVQTTKDKLSQPYIDLILDELNVKQFSQNTDPIPAGWLQSEPTENQPIVALNTQLTDELKAEGLLRDLAREFQQVRKQLACQPGQLIDFTFNTDSEEIKQALAKPEQEFLSEINAKSISYLDSDQELDLNLNGRRLRIDVKQE